MWRSAKRAEFEHLVREQLPDALRFATRLSGCPDVAEEIMQDALLRASRHWRSFRGDSRFQTWLYRIIVNCFHDRMRKARPVPETLSGETADRRQREPTDEVIGNEFSQLVKQAITQLPDRQREVLLLTVYEGFGAEEVARTLDTTVANVYSTLHVARNQLKKFLQPYLAET